MNQYLKQPGHALVFWSRILTVIVMTPYMRGIDLPTSPGFYGMVAATVFLGVGADIRTFNATARYGGGVVSRLMPATVWGSFFLWFILHTDLIPVYLAHPLNTLGIILALAGCVWFATKLNKCEITRAAMIYMLPAVFGYTMTTVLNKLAMGYGATADDFSGVVFTYMYVQSALSIFFLGPYMVWKEQKRPDKGAQLWQHKAMIFAAVLATFFWICHMVFKNYAMAYTPNPSYHAALSLTAPVFIALFYYGAGHKEKADVASGMGVVVCAILLVLMTIQPGG